MCSAKAVTNTVSTVGRVASGVVTLGGSEVLRKNAPNSVLSKIANAPGQLVSGGSTIPTVLTATGIVKPTAPDVPQAPDPTSPDPTNGPASDTSPPTTALSSDPTELAAQLRRRRLAMIGRGVASTIASSTSGDTSNPNLLTPTATGGTPSTYAAGMKAKLGQ